MKRILTTLFIAMLVAVPLATAAPGNLASADRVLRDTTGAETGTWRSMAEWNDDGADTMPAGAPGAGLSERLTASFAEIGSGAIVLDSRFRQDTTSANPGYFLEPVLQKNVMTPGLGQFYAWFGEWNDLNDNGVIDDYEGPLVWQTANATGLYEINDEFNWISTGTMHAWVWPSNPHVGCQPPLAFNLNSCRTNVPGFLFGDDDPENSAYRTLGALERDPNRQSHSFEYTSAETGGWTAEHNWMTLFIDESLLMTTWVMTVTNAAPLTGGANKWDYETLTRPDQLRDIDRYESLDPTVESLYLASVDASNAAIAVVDAALAPHVDTLNTALNATLAPAIAILNDVDLSDVDRTLGGAVEMVFGQYPLGITPEGCNPRDETCPYLDLRFHTTVPTFSGGEYPFPGYISPTTRDGARTNLPGFVTLWTHSGWWYDANGDGWIGEACDPSDPEEWDGEAGECRDPYVMGYVFDPNDYSDETEFSAACYFIREETTVTVTPDGAWPPGTMIVKTFRNPALDAVAEHNAGRTVAPVETVMGSDPVELRMQGSWCNIGSPGRSATRDALVLPLGTLAQEFTATITVDFPEGRDLRTDAVIEAVTLTHTVRSAPVL